MWVCMHVYVYIYIFIFFTYAQYLAGLNPITTRYTVLVWCQKCSSRKNPLDLSLWSLSRPGVRGFSVLVLKNDATTNWSLRPSLILHSTFEIRAQTCPTSQIKGQLSCGWETEPVGMSIMNQHGSNLDPWHCWWLLLETQLNLFMTLLASMDAQFKQVIICMYCHIALHYH